jgi:serine phosphatase RsbU (regulator of sigma subunit)/PAS domain-containing protein/anti-sigma regulatory factor (Ser/Thr protein kinase)
VPFALFVLIALAAVAVALVLGSFNRTRRDMQRAHAQVDSMVRNAPIGMAFVDRDGRFVEINETLAALDGRAPEALIGQLVADVPRVPPVAIQMIAEVLRTGATKLDVPFTGATVHAMAGFYPVRGADGSIDGVGIVVREVAAEQQRDLLFGRVTRLQELTASLAGAGTANDVTGIAVRSLQHALGARATSFCRVAGENVEVRATVGYRDDVVEDFSSFPLDADLPIAEAIRTGEPVLFASRDEIMTRHPQLRAVLVSGDTDALAAIPLRGESGVIGAIGLSFGEQHRFDADETAFLVAVATQCATAYQRAEAFEAERAVRRSAETANQRLAYLSEATSVLAESLDPETTLQRLADLAVPTLADWCAVHLVEGDVARPVAMASENPEATALVRELSERHPVRLDDPAGLGAVIRTGEPIVLRSVTMDAVRASTSEGEVVDLLSRLRSIAIVPMSYGGRVVGSIMLSNVTERELEDADVSLASELAARAAQAVTNAQLYQERAIVASTLQASLLPPSHPVIPGVDVATRFVPADGLQVGGDFYDVVRLGTVDEPAPTWALVIGDVRGKGADAAAITGIARATIRATALDEPSPTRMLGRLNQVLLAAAQDDRFATETGEPRFCTACVITVTPTANGADLVVAVGGHPRPYILRADGTSEQVGKHGGLIGVMADPGITDVTEHLAPGDTLVLYTDGITERHEGTAFFDEEQLGAVLAECVGFSAIATAAHVEGAASGFVTTPPRDDLALVVARIPELAAPGAIARQALPDDDRAAMLARRFVADALREIGATNGIDVAELLTSELVTNGLVHGLPPLDIEVATVAGGVRIAVGDHNPHVPTVRVTTGDDEHGRGLLLVDAMATRWGVDAIPPGKRVWFELEIH